MIPALTPSQIIAGRQLLRWSRTRLAAKMNGQEHEIAHYETIGVARRTFSAIRARQALEAAGVEFSDSAGATWTKPTGTSESDSQ